MAGSITAALPRIKRRAGGVDPLGLICPQDVEAACRELGHAWRDRTLDPATTVALFVQQVLHGNCPCSEVRLLGAAAGMPAFTAQAYCDARARLPLGVYQALLTRVIDAALPLTRRPEHLWLGRHRVWHVDGSSFSMPDTPELQKAFGQPGGQAKGCGFPVAHLLVLISAGTGLLLDAVASPLRTGDVGVAAGLHAHLEAGDVLVGDDTFGTYAHLALLIEAGVHGLFPVHHSRTVDFTPGRAHSTDAQRRRVAPGTPRSRWVRSLGTDDQVVAWLKPEQRPAWMSAAAYAALPDEIEVRELRRTVARPDGTGRVTLTMVTTLTDAAAYPADPLLGLRLRRWDVESDIDCLKTAMNMNVLRCETEAGVRKELAVFCLAYNLVRLVALEAARRQDVPVRRISFTDTLRWTRHARPGDVMPPLLVNPDRADESRVEPRCRKRRPKPYPLMQRPRRALRKLLRKQRKKSLS